MNYIQILAVNITIWKYEGAPGVSGLSR